MHSMAIKMNVSRKDQEAIHHLLETIGHARKRRKFHCTLGFVEKRIPENESTAFGEKITHWLQEVIDLQAPFYEVEKAAYLFGHVVAFLPTPQSLVSLKKMNIRLFEKVNEISEGRWRLSEETLPQNYTPHLTLWRTRHADHRLKTVEEFAKTHPIYPLSEAAYVIFP